MGICLTLTLKTIIGSNCELNQIRNHARAFQKIAFPLLGRLRECVNKPNYLAITMLINLIAELQDLRHKIDSAVLADNEDGVYEMDSEYSVKFAQILDYSPATVSEARTKIEFLITQLTENGDATSETDKITHGIISLFDQFTTEFEQNISELV